MTWRGEHIQVDETATGKQVWSWWKCCVCGKELTYGQHIKIGVHGRCFRRVGAAKADEVRRLARKADRSLWRRDHPSQAETDQ